VLKGLNFQVAPDEFVVILGPNGAGKTTLLRILASLSRPTRGDVRILGYELPGQASAIRRHLGVVSHQPLVVWRPQRRRNLRFYGRMYNILNLEQRVKEVLKLVGLESRRRDLIRTFSRGMQQRLAIGRAILHDPQIMLLDEPHTGLDQDASAMLDGLLRQIATADA
jgi:heme exporter protein A